MKYAGMPMAMWIIFHKSFRRNLTEVLKFDEQESRRITAAAKKKYRELIEKLPEFEKADRFKMNIVNCAMLSAFFLNMPRLPSVDDATEYYKKSMMTGMMAWFCRMSGKKKYSEADIQSMKATAKLKAGDRNPYSWNMDFHEYEDDCGEKWRHSVSGFVIVNGILPLQRSETDVTKVLRGCCGGVKITEWRQKKVRNPPHGNKPLPRRGFGGGSNL